MFSFHLSLLGGTDYITIGGYNKEQFHGELLTFKLVNTLHWSLAIRGISYGDEII